MQKPKVLLVDDDPSFLEDMKRDFSVHLNLITTECFDDAKRMILNEHFDLMLLDLYLDSTKFMHGHQLITLAKKYKPATPIIVITVESSTIVTLDTLKLGANHYLAKKEYDYKTWLDKILEYSKQTKIFLSHSSLDKPFVRVLKSHLQNGGISVFLDEDNIGIGSIPKQVATGIASSDFFMIVISTNSLKSEWVELELSRAKNKLGINKLIPIILDKPEGELPILIENLKWFDFSELNKFEWHQFEEIKKEYEKKCNLIIQRITNFKD